ncbi:FliM/FliN family flagellar motor switch protein [Celeribacter sp. PS-C1]|uniref:FliM/FliN family flagellar motor switch protein n=1 Tax=Celeribacter sp. PS-C1 TaxID=2820813 RepID=UPI001CA47956|nr:flagellar motor switch protein FliM [Celeribacter sp. PS-C1]MBW6417398.1 FliM/FliN family flagellar motor switch protein [Celeribacter sp. PS-C1]
MSDADIISAMRRKAGVGRPPPDVQPMSPAKALRLAMAKAAEDTIGLVLQVTEVVEERSTISRLPGQVPENALMSLLEGPNNAYGLAVLDKNAVSAIVEQQTTGKVLSLPPEDRPPTATDAVMCSDLCNQVLRQFESHIAEVAAPPEIAGFHVAAQLQEARSIAIAFDDVPYRLYRARVTLGRRGREGEVFFVFPFAAPKLKTLDEGAGDFSSTFQNVVMKSEARLDTVLHRVRLTLGDVTSLTEGMMIPIPREALSRVEVRADDRLVSRARLGQINGKRALRVVICANGEDDAEALGHEAFGAGDIVGATEFPALSGVGDMGMSDPAGGGDALPPLGDLPAMGDLPSLGDLGDLTPLSDLPPLGDLPPL